MRLNKLRSNQKRFQEKENLSQEQTALNEKIKKVDRVLSSIKESSKKKEYIAEKLENYEGYDKISDSDFESIKRAIKEIEKTETTLNTLTNSNRKKKVVEEKLNQKYLILFVVGLVFSVIIVGIPIAVYAYKRMKIKEEKEVVDETKENEILELTRNLSLAQKDILVKCAGVKDFNMNSFPDDYCRFTKLIEDDMYLSSSINELSKAELENSDEGRDVEENLRKIEAKKIDYLNRLTITQNNLNNYKLLTFTQEDFDELDDLDKRVEDLKRENTELKTSIKTTTSLVESPEDIREKIDAIEENKFSIEKKVEEHEIAAKFLALAETQVQQKFTPSIEKNSKPLLKEITNQKYSDLRIDEATMNITIKTPETEDYVNVSF